ncbi:MAG: FHA domain-containing protein [Clostridia bacterium]|nr:FHA domain-containing protein [Clostridia bacterium]
MKILCRKCPDCGRYSDVTVRTCVCGRDIASVVPEEVVSTEYNKSRGQIDESLRIYWQKCIVCGSINCVTDLKSADCRCAYCGKRKLAVGSYRLYESDETEDEKQLQSIGGRLHDMIGANQPAAAQQTPKDVPAAEPTPDDDDAPGWGDIIGTPETPAPETPPKPETPPAPPAPPKAKSITLSAMRYGPCTLSLSPEDAVVPVMLGREAMKKDYLSNDPYVGRQHCLISFKDGVWRVKDNNSSNGTFHNDRDLGLGGESPLSDGDRLKLGHRDDSIVFVVSFE